MLPQRARTGLAGRRGLEVLDQGHGELRHVEAAFPVGARRGERELGNAVVRDQVKRLGEVFREAACTKEPVDHLRRLRTGESLLERTQIAEKARARLEMFRPWWASER